MKRFHVHLHVDELGKNIAFYSALFDRQPARSETDYAKWMLDDPPVNFAISTRGTAKGVDHLGIQVESEQDLAALKQRAQRADMAPHDTGVATCCYARSDKYWLTDPQGVAWEQFRTLDSIPVFSEAASDVAAAPACCPSAVNNTTAPQAQPAAALAKTCC